MLSVIDEHAQHNINMLRREHHFQRLDPVKKQELILEICKSKHRFDKLSFFEGLPKHLWITFFQNMEE